MHFWSACISLRGPRPRNEDAFYSDPDLGLFLVADGLGGHPGGQIASRTCVTALSAAFRGQEPTRPTGSRLASAVRIADAAIRRQQRGAFASMGTTLVGLALEHAGAGVVAHVGDSRAYRLRSGRLERLTRDHSYVERMRASGMAPSPGMSHIVTRAMGHGCATPELREVIARPGDVFLLCTDGVSDVLPAATMAAVMGRAYRPLAAAERIAEQALRSGSRDNATALVIRID